MIAVRNAHALSRLARPAHQQRALAPLGHGVDALFLPSTLEHPDRLRRYDRAIALFPAGQHYFRVLVGIGVKQRVQARGAFPTSTLPEASHRV